MQSENAVPQSHFDRIVSLMVQAGYALISRVAISTDDIRYHVAAVWARDTSLFFHKLGKSIIVKISIGEYEAYDHGGQREFSAGSTVQIFAEFQEYREIISLLRVVPTPEDWDARYQPVPFQEEEIEIDGLEICGGWAHDDQTATKFEEMYPQDTPIPPDILVTRVLAALEPVMPFLEHGKFDRLQVTGFPPHYTFPLCENIFWERFDRLYFRHVVRDPWGSGDEKNKDWSWLNVSRAAQ